MASRDGQRDPSASDTLQNNTFRIRYRSLCQKMYLFSCSTMHFGGVSWSQCIWRLSQRISRSVHLGGPWAAGTARHRRLGPPLSTVYRNRVQDRLHGPHSPCRSSADPRPVHRLSRSPRTIRSNQLASRSMSAQGSCVDIFPGSAHSVGLRRQAVDAASATEMEPRQPRRITRRSRTRK